jgi:hypothetical protein
MRKQQRKQIFASSIREYHGEGRNPREILEHAFRKCGVIKTTRDFSRKEKQKSSS